MSEPPTSAKHVAHMADVLCEDECRRGYSWEDGFLHGFQCDGVQRFQRTVWSETLDRCR